MLSPLDIIGESWSFYQKHPVLNKILSLMIVPPMALIFVLVELGDEESVVYEQVMPMLNLDETTFFVVWMVLVIALSLWLVWGTACVLTVGKRLVKSAAGRSRSSFKTVLAQSKHFTFSLFLTEILRSCLTMLWGILFIIPGVIYAIRTEFFSVVTVVEGKEYRNALRGSSDIVKGKTWKTFLYIFGLNFLLFGPAWILDATITTFAPLKSAASVIIYDVAMSIVHGFLLVLYNLVVTVLYRELKHS